MRWVCHETSTVMVEVCPDVELFLFFGRVSLRKSSGNIAVDRKLRHFFKVGGHLAHEQQSDLKPHVHAVSPLFSLGSSVRLKAAGKVSLIALVPAYLRRV